MFYNNYDQVQGEDRWGLVGQVGDPFREDRQLKVKCAACGKGPLVIAERNWMATNPDHSQACQIVVACLACGAVDEFVANDGQEGSNGPLKRAGVVPQVSDLLPRNKKKK